MPKKDNGKVKDLNWLRGQVNQEINHQRKYFNTLSEFVYAQFESPSQQPVSDPKLDFRMFLNDTVNHQVEAFAGKIIGLIDEFSAAEGGEMSV